MGMFVLGVRILTSGLAVMAALLSGGCGSLNTSKNAIPEDSPALTMPPPPNRTVHSTMDDWQAAVCRPGSFQQGVPGVAGLPQTDWTAFCSSKRIQNTELGPALVGALIHIGHYSSFSRMADVFGDYSDSQATWATYETADGGIYVFLAGQAGTAPALDPLKQFGFQFSTP